MCLATQLNAYKLLNYTQLQYLLNQNLWILSCTYTHTHQWLRASSSNIFNRFVFSITGKWIVEWQKNKPRKHLSGHSKWNKSSVNTSLVSHTTTIELKSFNFFFKWNNQLTAVLSYFAAVIQEDTIEDIYTKVKNVIWSQSGPTIWVPSKENLWPSAQTTWTLPPRVRARPVSRTGMNHWAA